VKTCFISDLHLDASRPAATRAFVEFLQGPALSCDRLFILGDLFEQWVGDDDPDPHQRQVVEALGRYTRQQTRAWFMPGNRDFLLEDRFPRETGLTVLPDPTLIEVEGESVMLSHGDIFCTDDVSYQRFRRFARNPLAQRIYFALPFALKARIFAGAKSRSGHLKEQKAMNIMDVNQQAVETMLTRHGVSILLHGHTHRPGEHEFQLNGVTARRIVLSDWYDSGSLLIWDDAGRRTESLEFAA